MMILPWPSFSPNDEDKREKHTINEITERLQHNKSYSHGYRALLFWCLRMLNAPPPKSVLSLVRHWWRHISQNIVGHSKLV